MTAARWSDAAGCRGILVYTDHSMLDPWLVAQMIIQETEQISPLVAVQPLYMHPYTVAKMVASLAFLHRRRIYLNMVAGGFKNDLTTLDDHTPHDERYSRIVEYALIIRRLLEGRDAVTFDGAYYKVKNLRLTPPVPQELLPEIFISGSSEAGLAAARLIGATPVKYPKPTEDEQDYQDEHTSPGIRVGIIARSTAEEAWRVALERFPEDRKGQMAHALAMRVSDSQWHEQLSAMARDRSLEDTPYWLGPFQNYKTFCPYLVGDYERVGRELANYMSLGFKTFILDVPPSYDEFAHTACAFDQAHDRALAA